MNHKAFLDRSPPEVGAIITVSGSRLVVGDTLEFDSGGACKVSAFGLGRLVIDTGGGTFELRPWYKGDGPAPMMDGPSSCWTVSGMPNHTRPAA